MKSKNSRAMIPFRVILAAALVFGAVAFAGIAFSHFKIVIVWLNGRNVAGDGGIYRSTNAMGGSPTFTQTFVTTSTTTSNGRG